MTELTKKSTSLATTSSSPYPVALLPVVTHDVHSNLIVARSLLQRSLDQDDFPSALQYAVAISKLAPVAMKTCLRGDTLVLAPGVLRIGQALVAILHEHLGDRPDYVEIIDAFKPHLENITP